MNSAIPTGGRKNILPPPDWYRKYNTKADDISGIPYFALLERHDMMEYNMRVGSAEF